MAKFVVAGRSDCPYFARSELLGDRLQRTLENFHFHSIMVQPNEWDAWLKNTCNEKGWTFSTSPIVWRELIDRGGKGVLIGGSNDFQEYVKAYYDLESEMNSYDMRTIATENKSTKDELDAEEQACKAMSKPIHVCITNGSSSICYHMLSALTSGEILGPKTEVNVNLLVGPDEDIDLAYGNAMEAEDLGHKLLRNIKVCTKPDEAYQDCKVIVMLGTLPKKDDETKKQWLTRNSDYFSKHATIMNRTAMKCCKVLIWGEGPLNFVSMQVRLYADSLARQNIIGVSAVKENNAKAVLGERLNVNPAGVVDLIVWGNVNGANHIDVSKCRVHGYDGAVWGPYWYSQSSQDMVHDNKWCSKEFPILVEGQRHKLSKYLLHNTAMSTANAIVQTLKNWFLGSPSGQMFSLVVISEGWYGVPDGYHFSFPVTMDPKGYWHVVQDVNITAELKQGIAAAIQDLKKEIETYKGERKGKDSDNEEDKEEEGIEADTSVREEEREEKTEVETDKTQTAIDENKKNVEVDLNVDENSKTNDENLDKNTDDQNLVEIENGKNTETLTDGQTQENTSSGQAES